MTEPIPQEANAFFNRQWEIYRRVLSFNYMFHEEFAAVTRESFAAHFHRPFSLLDLGCGDAYFTARAVAGTPLADYLGVDLAAPALHLARGEMNAVAGRVGFLEDDLARAVHTMRSRARKFDAVIASYSVHHLGLEAKAELFAGIRDLLQPGGVFLMVDLLRRDNESREDFQERYIAWLERNWTAFNADEFAMIGEHIRTSDFPESPSTLNVIAHEAGCTMDLRLVTPVQTEAFCRFQF